MTVIRMSVATATASMTAKISLCAVIVYNDRLGRRKWRYNRSIKPAPGVETENGATRQTRRLSHGGTHISSMCETRFRVQELRESRGGRPGLLSLISLRFLWT